MLGGGGSDAGMLETRGGCSTGFTGETLMWKGAELSFNAFT